MRRLAILVLLLSTLASAQIRGRHRLVTSGGGAVTFTMVQHTIAPAEQTCGSNVSPCSLTVTSTGSGHLGVLIAKNTDGSPITLGTVTNGGTWVLPSLSGGVGTGCAPGGTYTTGILDCAYTLSTSASATTIQWTYSDNTVHGHVMAEFYEVSRSSGSFSTPVVVGQNKIESASTSHIGGASTLGGVNSAIIQGCFTVTNYVSSISAPYTGDFFTTGTFGFGAAYSINTTDGSAPMWSGDNNYWYWNWLAFQ